MKNYIKYLTITGLALVLVASPLVGFAKENENKENKGNKDNSNKVEKTLRVNAQVNQNSKSDDSDKDSDDVDHNKNREDSNSDNKASLGQCVTAFGHLIAPGWIKKNGTPNIDTTNCWLPFGIAKKFSGYNASTTPDVTSPVISGIAFDAAQTQAEVRWATNESSNGVVFWNTTSSVDTSSTATNRVVKNNFTKDHKVIVTGLVANTTYYVVVKSSDSAGNSSQSGVSSFTTLATTTDNSAPVISNVVTTIGTSTIKVGWMTNENTTDRVYYGTVLPLVLNASTTSYVVNASSTQNRVLTISGLAPSTTYYLVIESTDTSGNVTTSTTFSAHTGDVVTIIPPIDVVAPVISGFTQSTGSTLSTLTWTTNEPATTKIWYSAVTPVSIGGGTSLSVTNSSLVTNHSIQIANLVPMTTYYFRAQSTDAAGNSGLSNEISWTTGGGI